MFLTFSHNSAGRSPRLNRISAKAGCFSAAVQLKLRLFFNQDMETLSGASYLTVNEKQNITFCTLKGHQCVLIGMYLVK